MFGYVIANKEELKLREFREYRSYYCGLCHALGRNYGAVGRLSVSYDLTFLAILLTGLYEPEEQQHTARCVAHPMKRDVYVESAVIDYAAHMNALLTYYKCKDDYRDGHKRLRLVYGNYLGRKGSFLKEHYPAKCKEVMAGLRKLEKAERAGIESMDTLAACFGEVLRSIFRYRDDEWSEDLGRVGYYLGKFIYLLDAYEDMEKDRKEGDFNPLLRYEGWQEEQLKQYVTDMLMHYAAECAKAFETLPILKHVEILRNILYSGIWCVYYGRCRRNLKPLKRSEEKHERSL